MSADHANGAPVTVGKNFVIMGGDRIEVGPRSHRVTAYTYDAVEVKTRYGSLAPGVNISPDFNTVVLNGVMIERAADKHLVISAPGAVSVRRGPKGASARPAQQTGDPQEKFRQEFLAAAEAYMRPAAFFPTRDDTFKNVPDTCQGDWGPSFHAGSQF